MSLPVFVQDPAGRREVPASEFPLTLGGTGPGARPLPGWINVSPAVTLHLGETGVSIEPCAPDVPLSINRKRLPGRVALVDGDNVRIGEAEIRVSVGDDVVLRLSTSLPAPTVITPAAPGPTASSGPRLSDTPGAPPPARPSKSALRRVLGLLLFLLLLACGAVAAYVLMGRRVAVVVEPAPATFELSGGLVRPRIRESWLLLKGSYRVKATLEGYHPLDETITVDDRADQSFRFDLRKLPGRMTVEAHRRGRPETKVVAAVTLDAKAIGDSPLADFPVEHGPRVVALSAPRYESAATNLVVEGLGRPFRVDLPLKPIWADVLVRSEPPGAAVTVDDALKGVTPADVEIDEGRHTLRLVLPLHVPVQTTMVFQADTRVELPVVRLELSPGVLDLTTDPPGASVSVNGEYVGRTPFSAPVKARAPLHVAVSRNGFHEEAFDVTIEPEQHERRELRLRAILGEVRLTVEPADAEVRVNGKPWTGGQPMNLPADATRIDVAKEGFEPWSRTVTPRPGFPIDVRAVLKPIAPPPPPPEPPSAASALGLEMVKPPPGDVTMGSSRREQGRRSNETLRQVRITRPFAISKTEITNEAFRKFRAAHKSGAFGGQTLDAPSQPVVMVSWQDASAFCNWLSAQEGLPPAYVEKGGTLVAADPMTTGYRLPTEAEWEFCARIGAPAGAGVFPWNGTFPPPNKAGNFADAGARTALGFGIDGYVDGFTCTAPPGKFTPSPSGLFDLAGNVAEWCHDFYSIPAAAAPGAPPETDPVGPREGTHRVIRGSGWRTMLISDLRTAFRDYGVDARDDLGFRIARTLGEPKP
jgi:formylglycine-generating enzyme required for sulfatase activity